MLIVQQYLKTLLQSVSLRVQDFIISLTYNIPPYGVTTLNLSPTNWSLSPYLTIFDGVIKECLQPRIK